MLESNTWRRGRRLLMAAASTLVLLSCDAGDSADSEEGTNPIPGDACESDKPIVCGSLSSDSTQNQVILFCRDGTYESVMECKPTGNGETNRCMEGGNNTVADCLDEPEVGDVTRCEVQASGKETGYVCTVGQL